MYVCVLKIIRREDVFERTCFFYEYVAFSAVKKDIVLFFFLRVIV